MGSSASPCGPQLSSVVGLVQLDFDVVRACRRAESFHHCIIVSALDNQGNFVFVANESNTKVSAAGLVTESSGAIMFFPAILAVLDDCGQGWILPKERFEATSAEISQIFAAALCELTDLVRHRRCGLAGHMFGTVPRGIQVPWLWRKTIQLFTRFVKDYKKNDPASTWWSGVESQNTQLRCGHQLVVNLPLSAGQDCPTETTEPAARIGFDLNRLGCRCTQDDQVDDRQFTRLRSLFNCCNNHGEIMVATIARFNHEAHREGASCEGDDDLFVVPCLRNADMEFTFLISIHRITCVWHKRFDEPIFAQFCEEPTSVTDDDDVLGVCEVWDIFHRNECVYEGFNLVLRSEQYNVFLSS